MDAAKQGDLGRIRVLLNELYDPDASPLRREDVDEMELTPQTFSPLVDAAVLAKLSECEEVAAEMVLNMQSLAPRFGVAAEEVQCVEACMAHLRAELTKDEARALLQKHLKGRALLRYSHFHRFL